MSPTHAPSLVTVLLTEMTGVHLRSSIDNLSAGGEAQVNVFVQCFLSEFCLIDFGSGVHTPFSDFKVSHTTPTEIGGSRVDDG